MVKNSLLQGRAMNRTTFWNHIRANDHYHTTGSDRNMADRLMGWSDSWYYLRGLSIIICGCVIALLRRFTRDTWSNRSIGMLNLIEGCGGHVNITGLNNIAKLDKPVVYISNHMSVVETMLVPGAIVLAFQDVTTVVKESLLHYPFFGPIMKTLDPISVTRKNPRKDLRAVLEKGELELRNGRSVVLFPQATRAPGFQPASFNTLGVKLAKRAGVQVVPVALKTDFQQPGRRIKDIGPLDRSKTLFFRFGKPLSVENSKETHEQVVRFIVDNLRSWGAVISER